MGISETGYNEIIKDLNGSITQNRFKYQRFWAIKKMYELYENGDEFIVIFDFASDIDVSINDDLHFYQVKTDKNKKFTINRLIKTKKESKDKIEHSILSKLAILENCKGVKSLNVVSNNYLSEKDKNDKELQIICFHELKKEIQNQITNHIKEKAKIVPDLSKYFYIKSNLCLDSSYQTLLGHTVEFLENNFNTNETRAKLFLDWLLRETERKSTYEHDVSNNDDIVKHKGFTKKEFLKLLKNYDSTDNKMLERVSKMINDNYGLYESPELFASLKEITRSNLNSIRNKNSLMQIRNYILENKVSLSLKSERNIIEEIVEKATLDSSYDYNDKKCLAIIGFVQFKEKG